MGGAIHPSARGEIHKFRVFISRRVKSPTKPGIVQRFRLYRARFCLRGRIVCSRWKPLHYYAGKPSREQERVSFRSSKRDANETLCRDHETGEIGSLVRTLASAPDFRKSRCRPTAACTRAARVYEQIGNLLSGEFALEISGNSSSGSVTGVLCEFLKA